MRPEQINPEILRTLVVPGITTLAEVNAHCKLSLKAVHAQQFLDTIVQKHGAVVIPHCIRFYQDCLNLYSFIAVEYSQQYNTLQLLEYSSEGELQAGLEISFRQWDELSPLILSASKIDVLFGVQTKQKLQEIILSEGV